MDDDFRLLFVCTANICRSAMAEAMTRSLMWAPENLSVGRVVVASAGTRALPGCGMALEAVKVLRLLGVEAETFQARELRGDAVLDSHLVLTAAREHRSHVLRVQPRALHKVFTLGEFSALAEAVPIPQWSANDTMAERGRALLDAVVMVRRESDARAGKDDDLADPYGGPERGYYECAQTIFNALERPLGFLRGDGAAWSPERNSRGTAISGLGLLA